MPSDVTQDLLSASANRIFELELAPLYLSLHLWSARMRGGQLVCYLDNDGARRSVIRSYAESRFALNVIEQSLRLETDCQLKVWFGRVPTSSNIAAGPSRLDFNHLLKLGAAAVQTPVHLLMPCFAEGCGADGNG